MRQEIIRLQTNLQNIPFRFLHLSRDKTALIVNGILKIRAPIPVKRFFSEFLQGGNLKCLNEKIRWII